MDDSLSQMITLLQKLIGQHGQLLEVVRSEREALVHADLKALEKSTEIKHGIIESIRQTESERLKKIGQWAIQLKLNPRSLSLQDIIHKIQPTHSQIAERLRSLSKTLTLLIQRIQGQSQESKGLIERSLAHINEMKSNALKESNPAACVYTPQGQRSNGGNSSRGSRLISTEG